MSETQTEKKPSSEFETKIEDMLVKQRRIFFSKAVDDKSAAEAIRNLWYLDYIDSKKPIYLYINSPGGSVDSGFAIWDQIKMISAPVYTCVTGLAASMGSVLSIAGEKGKRCATQNARIMIHQPLIPGVIQGQATDLEIQAKEIIKTRNQLIQLYCAETGQNEARVEKALDRDTWLSSEEAKDFGLIDCIITNFTEFETN